MTPGHEAKVRPQNINRAERGGVGAGRPTKPTQNEELFTINPLQKARSLNQGHLLIALFSIAGYWNVNWTRHIGAGRYSTQDGTP
jgi:hypothetical protein